MGSHAFYSPLHADNEGWPPLPALQNAINLFDAGGPPISQGWSWPKRITALLSSSLHTDGVRCAYGKHHTELSRPQSMLIFAHQSPAICLCSFACADRHSAPNGPGGQARGSQSVRQSGLTSPCILSRLPTVSCEATATPNLQWTLPTVSPSDTARTIVCWPEFRARPQLLCSISPAYERGRCNP